MDEIRTPNVRATKNPDGTWHVTYLAPDGVEHICVNAPEALMLQTVQGARHQPAPISEVSSVLGGLLSLVLSPPALTAIFVCLALGKGC